MTADMFHSQFDEDRILNGIFAGKSPGICVEVGANDGVHGSNTLFFEKLGWQCVLIEPNPMLPVASKSVGNTCAVPERCRHRCGANGNGREAGRGRGETVRGLRYSGQRKCGPYRQAVQEAVEHTTLDWSGQRQE